MKKFIQNIKMKPLDFLILFLLLTLSFTPWIITGVSTMNQKKVTYSAELKANGKIIQTFQLDKNQKYTYTDKHGDENKIEVNNGKIRMFFANCPDQVCVRKGWISKGGETIVCLPHKLVIEVIASDGSMDGSVIY